MAKIILFVFTLLASFATVDANMGDIRVQDLANQNISLNELVNDGKYTLVMIWSTDCVACEEQKPMIQAFHNDYKDSNASVIGIANDGMDMLAEINVLLDKNEPSYPNYIASPTTFFSDFEISTGKKFRATPTYIMFNPDGQVMGVAVGQIARDRLDQIVTK